MQWLSEALSYRSIGEPEVLRRATEALSAPETDTTSEERLKLRVLRELEDVIEATGMACSFAKAGGFPHLIRAMVGSGYIGVRKLACQIFASAVQNNPAVQMIALRAGAYTALVPCLLQELNCELKALYVSCFSSLLRGQSEDGREVFAKNQGILIVKELLQDTAAVRVVKKVLLLLADLFYNEKLVGKDDIVTKAQESGLIQQLQVLQQHWDEEVQQMAVRATSNALEPLTRLH